MKAATAFLAVSAFAILAAGCAAKPLSPAPTVLAARDRAFEAVWQAAEEVLREHRFTIDRADRRDGVITALPLLSRHGLELWRKDAVTDRDRLEGTLQTIYRQVTVRLRRRDPAKDKDLPQGEYVADVAVRVTRSNKPALQVTSAADAYDLFFAPGAIGRSYAEAGCTAAAPRQEKVDLGRDENLEAVLRGRIHRAAAKNLTLYPQ
jgi:hypothetical protein